MPKKTTRPPSPTRRARPRTLILIGLYKLLEGSLLILAGIGILRLLHRDVGEVALRWVHAIHVDPQNRYIHRILTRVTGLSPRQLEAISAGTFIYAALRWVEGIGLVLRKRWGEVLTAVATGVFIPLEVYELLRHPTFLRAAALIVNAAILVYLIAGLRRGRR